MRKTENHFNNIGITSKLDMPRIRHLMKIGLVAAIMVLTGDMLLGYGAADSAVAGIPVTFARYLGVSDGRIFWSAVLGMVGIPLECLCYFAIYRLIACKSEKYAHTYRAGIFGCLIFGGCGVHVPCDRLEQHRESMKKQQTDRFDGRSYDNKRHLPMMGVGPLYGAVIITLTVIAVIMGRNAAFENGRVDFLKIPLFIIGILLILLGVYLWTGAMFQSKIESHITENRLATTGVYALVRNPIYSAFMFFCTGVLMIAGNIIFLPLFFFYWLFMTVLMRCTEEKWLKNLYGREYEEYLSRVNRCIPWLPHSE